MSSKDPFLSKKLKAYKDTIAKKAELSFLQRMEADSGVRKTILKLIDNQLGVEDLRVQARQSS